ncbi:MAG: ADP-dependent NAD(P)H-hydrate dehydratase [Bacteroidetes bacterium HLUCCA01]|nr:MAG: ADP-dependent NAD(P)H-hydrate dehydratase [Bacteroidetes bacterium HLUCCA01]
MDSVPSYPLISVFSGDDSRAIDAETIHRGVPSTALMEMAGAAAASRIAALFPLLQEASIYCGKGNNGGDGWVIARHLHAMGVRVAVYAPQDLSACSDDARVNAVVLQKLATMHPDDIQIHGYPVATAVSEDSDVAARSSLTDPFADASHDVSMAPSIIIDALLGTGITDEVRSPYREVVACINAGGLPVVAVDVPSGIDANTGAICGIAVQANHTICLGTLKTGCFLGDGPAHSGYVHRLPLGFRVNERRQNKVLLIPGVTGTLPATVQPAMHTDESITARILQRRHKYETGLTWVVGGSDGLLGAAVVAGKAAWKTGCGAVILYVPAGLVQAAEVLAPELVIRGTSRAGTLNFGPEDIADFRRQFENRPGTLLLGPGIGRTSGTAEFARSLLNTHKQTAVVDADALHVFDPNVPARHILTPHPGEWQVLTGQSAGSDWNRLEVSRAYAAQYGHTVLSKGYPSLICSPGTPPLITGYDTRRFTRAGFGDVLAGKIAGLYSQTNDVRYSCVAALIDGKLGFDSARANGTIHPEPADVL